MLQPAAEGKPPIKSCSERPNAIAHLQLDYNWPEENVRDKIVNLARAAYPQIQLLDEIHEEFPNATFLLMLRPVNSWVKSALGCGRDMVGRWARCHVPGLRKHPNDGPLTTQDLSDWWCSHVHHVREFLKHHPSHPLIELDLMNCNETAPSLTSERLRIYARMWPICVRALLRPRRRKVSRSKFHNL